jgi:hypothetical protein
MRRPLLLPFLALLLAVPPAAHPQEDPVVLGRTEVRRWDFEKDAEGWSTTLDAVPAGAAPSILRILARGGDPALLSPPVSLDASSKRYRIRLRLKTPAGGAGQLFWATAAAPTFEESRSVRFPLGDPGAFREVEIPFGGLPPGQGAVTRFRLDPGASAGPVEIDWIILEEVRLHPMTFGPGVQDAGREAVRVVHAVGSTADREIGVDVRAIAPAGVRIEGLPLRLVVPAGGRAELAYTVRLPGAGVFPVDVELAYPEAPLRRRATVRAYPTLQQFVSGALPFVPIPLTESVTAVVWRTPGAPPSVLFYHANARDAAPAAELTYLDHLVVAGGPGGAGEALALPTESPMGGVRDARGQVVGHWEWTHERRGPALAVRATFRAAAPLAVRRMEGVLLRVPGRGHEGALFGGLEFLGKDEASSSTDDFDPPDNVRAVPDPLKVTIPLMGVARDGAAVGLAWPLAPGTRPDALVLQPTFSVPNAVDGEPNLRLSIAVPAVGHGRRENAWEAERPLEMKAGESLTVEATLHVLPGADLGGLIAAWLKDRPLPPPPDPPRDAAAALKLARTSFLDSSLWDPQKKGWGHCAEKNWERHPFRDHLGYLWKLGLLGGKADGPEARRVREVMEAHPAIPPSGAHIATRMVPFTLGPVDACLAAEKASAEAAMAQQRPDGLWTYEGRFQRGHSENTASGFCAERALVLLEYARSTLDPRAMEAGLRALEAMKRFNVPRGAQTWELSLHTPDILGAAHLVGAYVRGYELTRDPALLEAARAWALAGLPFVYLWDRADLPTMRYATIAVYGATHWKAPNWIGLPVQWCGTVYAWRLLELAKHDRSIDWRRVAEGITAAAERMLWPDGPFAGCLPDSFALARQARNGPMINPGAVLACRLALGGDRPDAATDLVEWGGKPLAVTTVARDVAAEKQEDGSLVLRGRFHPGAACVWQIAGPGVREVTVNGAAAPRVEAWPPFGPAWRAAGGGILVRIDASRGADEIRLR